VWCALALAAALLQAVSAVAQSPAPPSSSRPALPLLDAGSTLDLRWVTAFDSPAAAAPGFDTERAYVPLRGGSLVAVDLDDGGIRWSLDGAGRQTPATGDGLVFVARERSVRALRAATGATAWETPLPGALVSAPYWDTGWLVVSLDSGDLAALRATDGTLVWRQSLGATLATTPAPALDSLYLALTDGRVVAVGLATGVERWTRRIEGTITGLLALDDELVVGSTAKALYSLDLDDGDIRWRWRLGAAAIGAAVADARRIYAVAFDHVLRAFDRRTGNLRWSTPLPTRPAGRSPVLAGSAVFVPSYTTELEGYSVDTGQKAVTLTLPGEAAGGAELRPGGRATSARVIALTLEGQLAGFGPRIEPPPAALDALPGLAVTEPPAPSTAAPPPPGSAPAAPPSTPGGATPPGRCSGRRRASRRRRRSPARS
jgi:outer membrane protein assembly factor BamB